MIYTIEEIRAAVLPIAQKYSLKAVYLFGSYARGTATESSDIDIMAVMDTISVADLKLYRNVLISVGNYEKSC